MKHFAVTFRTGLGTGTMFVKGVKNAVAAVQAFLSAVAIVARPRGVLYAAINTMKIRDKLSFGGPIVKVTVERER